MRITLSQIIGLSVSACWLLSSQQVAAQGSTIAYTVVINPNPFGGFRQELGAPVYHGGPGRPGALLVDLDLDGVSDYRVVATGSCDGFNMEGLGTNAIWTRPTGGNDLGGWIRPLAAGTEIGPLLPAPDEWMITWVTTWEPVGTIAPGFSSYCSYGSDPGIGLFRNMTAYVGLKFYIGTNAHYGWIKVEELPFLAGGGIVHEYAYETRPNIPIAAGAGTPNRVEFMADCSGINEVPRNNSPHAAQGSFILVGDKLFYRVVVGLDFLPTTATIHGPANSDSISRQQMTTLAPFAAIPLICLPARSCGLRQSRSNVAQRTANRSNLLAGRFYVNFTSSCLSSRRDSRRKFSPPRRFNSPHVSAVRIRFRASGVLPPAPLSSPSPAASLDTIWH